MPNLSMPAAGIDEHPLAVGAWQMPNLSMPTSVSRTARPITARRPLLVRDRAAAATLLPVPRGLSLYPEDLAAMMTGAHPVR